MLTAMATKKVTTGRNAAPEKLHTKNDNKKSKEASHTAMSCIICADENVKFAATGSCDHPICSLCSMRIRVKNLDTSCPLCKQVMEVVVVFPTELKGEQSFASFGIWGIETLAPGLDVDHRAGMVYADCKNHFREMDKIRSIVCPLKKCNMRFPSQDNLLKHLTAAHSGQNLCTLCLKNRPLFIPEHQLMTTGELKKHMSAPPGALTGAGGDKTAGHPLCLFCDQHFFDSHALYIHMKQEHQSCHLCPASYQFRFYPSVDELRTHLQREHFVCNICEKANANGNDGPGIFGSSFRTHGDYSAHLLSFHGVRNSSMTLGFRVEYSADSNNNGGRGSGRSNQSRRSRQNQLQFLDLDMAAADPNRNSSNQTQPSNFRDIQHNRHSESSRAADHTAATQVPGAQQVENASSSETRRRQLFHLQTSAAIASAPLVPPHMRVAGRIVGGRFQRDADDDALQAIVDEQALVAAATSSGTVPRGQPGWAGRPDNSRSMNMAFPALVSTNTTSAQDQVSAQKPAAPAPHPMSLVSGIQREAAAKRALAEERKEKEAELEDRKARRNEIMAGALGVRPYGAAATHSVGDVAFDPSELRKPLYPATLLTWAKNNKVEVQKLEKKILDLIADKKSNSTQLKPMGPSSRNAVHGLSRYYFLNSYEYDPEPRRYISLVKSAESSVPSIRLAVAVTAPTLPPANMIMAMCIPALYVTLANPSKGFAPTDTINEARGRKKGGDDTLNLSQGGSVTVGDVVGRMRAVVKAQLLEDFPYSLPNDHRIVSVKAVGASSVRSHLLLEHISVPDIGKSILLTDDLLLTFYSPLLTSQISVSFPDMIAAFHVLEMIKNYKKNGTSATSDITPGLFDHFYIDPAFDPDIYKEVAEPPVTSDQAEGVADRFLDSFGDPDFFRPSHSMPMHINSAAQVLKSSQQHSNGASSDIKLTFDDSLAAELAGFYDSDDAAEENISELKGNEKLKDDSGGKKPFTAIPMSTDLYIPPHRMENNELAPPPGFASKKVESNDHEIKEDKDDKFSAKFETAPAATYRHLILQPRSIPIPPSIIPATPPV